MQRWLPRLVVACLACACGGIASAEVSAVDSAAALYARHGSLRDQLSHNQFQRPLHLDSMETPDELRGDIHALIGYPFPVVRAALGGASRWCDILILHLNIKSCRASTDAPETVLRVSIGRKFDDPLNAAHRVDLVYRVAVEASDYFRLVLNADKGPFGTRNYRIILEAVPLDRGRTFIHLSYAYGYGASAKIAMQTYLRTFGSQKVGFTVTEQRADGQLVRVGGLRAALERNVMRYYLAINAYLAALAAPPEERLEERLRDWFTSTERYALQLHEVEQSEYLEMKRRECALLKVEP
ncbi:MAG TPA: hypothetical protein VGR42_00670 [Casimicrobiaceae bacterium]|nr:hypothetical protein [Casimicrobiaceae bacterium]